VDEPWNALSYPDFRDLVESDRVDGVAVRAKIGIGAGEPVLDGGLQQVLRVS